MRKIILSLVAVVLFGVGCVSVSSGPSGADGGVYKSINNGQEWAQKSVVPMASKATIFGATNIRKLSYDPQDSNAIYASTRENGMFYSFDGAESWKRPAALVEGFVADVVVDYSDKCNIYVAFGHRILKSTDCNRTFQEVYRETADTIYITALAVDPFDNKHIYAGTINGALIESLDSGKTWGKKQAFSKNQMVGIVFDKKNKSVIYIGFASNGLWKTTDGGESFVDLSKGFKDKKGGSDIRGIVIDPEDSNRIFVHTKTKIMKSGNGGVDWEALPIISPANVEISAFAINPQSTKDMYYGTSTTFYRSQDGGATWSTKKLPTTRAATAILVDFKNPSVIYLGSTKIDK